MISSNKNIRIFNRMLDNSNIRKQDNVCYRYASYIYALQAVNSSSIKVMNRIFSLKGYIWLDLKDWKVLVSKNRPAFRNIA